MFLLLRAERGNVMGADGAMDNVPPGGVRDAGLFLHQHCFVGEVAPTTAVFLRDADAQQPGFPGQSPKIPVHLVLLRPSGVVWRLLLLEEGADHGPEVVQFFGVPRRAVFVQNHE